MEMTFDEYIQNPMGVANAVISNRVMYRDLYTQKLDFILVREAGNIEYHLYKKNDNYIAYLKIPSEVVDKFYYDVLIEFRPPKKAITGTTLKDYYVRFYSNDPSFVFTFTHAFIANKIFITELSDKMSKKAIKEKAKEKNPKDQVGYVKSLYFAYLIMSKRGLFNKVKYMEKYNDIAVKNMIMPADQKIELRIEAQEKIAKQKKKAKAEVKRQMDDFMQKELPTQLVTPKRGIKTVGKVKAISGNKKTNTIKTVKKR